ncbi:glycosyltransferase family 2 protein [Acinetobacter faecalis]|uniref:glycosyltransferase family 2 protein n=1 Tax=Acinetobacter faecalis TaxID=2665161 RepID=UPI002A90AC28|nr:glycosyltransferase [Acinetobacter faecalis]MDY6460513.1 glycosyltransferase [Acinetobacter faecalis]
MNKLLSIVIPIYGVELYIEEFLESFLHQITDEVECIFVNDGTKDHSIEILKRLVSKYKVDYILINQENKGLSSARNTGLRSCTGQYISFLDPDDIVSSEYIKKITKIIKENKDIDLVHFNAKVIDFITHSEAPSINLVNETKISVIDYNFLIENFKKNLWFSWLRVFKADLIKKFSFPEGYIMEDILSLPLVYKENILIYELYENLITYRVREGSLSNVKNDKFIGSVEHGIDLFRKFRTQEHMKYVYFHLLDILYSMYIKMSCEELLSFQKKFKEDFIYISKNIPHSSFKKRLKWSNPKIFYIYKTRFYMKKIK